MPKTKAKSTGEQRGKSKKKEIYAPLLRVLALALVVALIAYFWTDIKDWSVAIWQAAVTACIAFWEYIWGLFGIGLFIVIVAATTILVMIVSGKFALFTKYWRWWLGGIPLAAAIWGIASLFTPGSGIVSSATLGGKIGKSIIGSSSVTAALRISGLLFLGVLFLAPRWTWRAFVATIRAIGKSCSLLWSALSKFIKLHAQPRALPKGATAKRPEGIPEIVEVEGVKTTSQSGLETWEPGNYQPTLTPSGWQLPPISILDRPTEVELSQSEIEKRAQLIEEALASYGVEAKVVQINVGPTVTQFGVEPGWDRKYKEIKERDKDGNIRVRLEEVSKTRVKVDRIASLASDLALALAAPSIRIEAPVPGKSIVGIEVPNTTFGLVNLRSVIESTAFQKTYAKSKLALALGKGPGGEAIAADLTKMPHLLIAGATGSGKTACLNSIICCLLMHNTPEDVQFILIDPKRVELINFNSIPHLIAPVVVDTDKAVMALRWLNQEMDNRYQKFAQAGARNIESYNKNRAPGDTMPYIVLIIDELADLMMAAFDEVERTLCRLAQLARATGIHLIVATQRPSVDVITGLIKANFPTRISFALTSQVDSRTILDTAGAEKLLGRGDMLYMPTDASKPKRLQGTFVSDPEIERLVNFWANQRRPGTTAIRFEEMKELASKQREEEDSLLDAARQLALEHKHISTSFLQRRLRIGYPRAARLMEKLQEEGYQRGTSTDLYNKPKGEST